MLLIITGKASVKIYLNKFFLVIHPNKSQQNLHFLTNLLKNHLNLLLEKIEKKERKIEVEIKKLANFIIKYKKIINSKKELLKVISLFNNNFMKQDRIF